MAWKRVRDYGVEKGEYGMEKGQGVWRGKGSGSMP